VTDSERARGVVAGMTAYVAWGLLTVYWKALRDFDAFELIGWRVSLSAVLMALVLTATRGWSGLRPVVEQRALLGRVALAAVLLTVNWTSYVWAVVHGNVIETALGYFMAPLGTMAVGVLVLGERLRTAQRVAVALAVVAVCVLTVSYGRVPWIALTLAATWTAYGYLKKQVPLTGVQSMAAESLLLLIPAALVIAVTAGRDDSITSSASGGQLTLVLLSGLVTVLPLVMFAFAARRVPLTVLGPMQYAVPSINFLLGWLVYDEPLPASRVIGFGLVWAALVVLSVDAARRGHAARRRPVVDHVTDRVPA